MNEHEEQRRSFAYGNTNIGNPRVTRTMVDKAAEALTDAARLDFIEENRLYLYADRNDVGESCYEVMDLFDQVIGEGATVRDAIDAAISASKAGNEAALESSNARSQGGEVSMEQKNAQVVQQLQSLKNRLSSDKDAQTQLDQIIQQLQQEDQGSQERKSSR